jgi:hypothetical protein
VTASYIIRAMDPAAARRPPGGARDFPWALWSTPELPRIGEEVKLPTKADAGRGDWQELSVVAHYPGATHVWLGGADGWEDGSVRELFASAVAWRLRRETRARDEEEPAE